MNTKKIIYVSAWRLHSKKYGEHVVNVNFDTPNKFHEAQITVPQALGLIEQLSQAIQKGLVQGE